MRKSFVPGAVGLLRVCALAAGAAESQQNLIANPSFEEASGDNPGGWRIQGWGGRGNFTYAEIGRMGNRTVMTAGCTCSSTQEKVPDTSSL